MHRKNAGFTVIELLTALTLLSLVIFTFTPFMAYSLAQIATAGSYNSALHNAAGEIEGAQAQILDDMDVEDTTSFTVADHLKTTDMMVVFQKDGVTDSSGTQVEYASGTELQPNDSSSLLDSLLAFVGIKIEGSLSLTPAVVRVDDTFPLTVTVTPTGFTFRDQDTVNSKMKLIYTDSTGVDQTVPNINFTYVNENTVTFVLQQDSLSYDNSPYRLYYGSYFAYQPIQLIDFEALDLVVAGTGGKVAISTGIQNTDGTYDWVFESNSIDYIGDSSGSGRTINDILWMAADDSDDSRFIGVGDSGMYFEISEGTGLDFSFRPTGFASSYNSSSGDISASGNLNQAIISPSDPTKIEVAGSFYLSNESANTAGQFVFPTSISDNTTVVTGVASSGSPTAISISGGFVSTYESTTVQTYERFDGTIGGGVIYNTYTDKNTGPLMNNDATAIASGIAYSETLSGSSTIGAMFTLSIAENNRIIYYNHTTGISEAVQFSERYLNSYSARVERCTVPATITNATSDTNSVTPTSIAYGLGAADGYGMFMVGMDDGSIYCIESPERTTDTYTEISSTIPTHSRAGFGWRERSSQSGSNTAITSITYDSDNQRWIAVSEDGLILYRDYGVGGSLGTTTWKEINVSFLSGVNLTKVIYIPSTNSSVAEYFVVGEDWTIAHVNASTNTYITNTSNWKKDTIYTYYDVDDPDANVEVGSSDGNMTFNTVARRLED